VPEGFDMNDRNDDREGPGADPEIGEGSGLPRPGDEPARRIVVVGGGISGLVAAWRLVDRFAERLGRTEILLLEADERVGGKLHAGETGGVQVDLGAESVLARRPGAVRLFDELGLRDDVVHPRALSASVVSRGALYPLPRGTVMGVPVDRAHLRSMAGILDTDELARAAAESGRETFHLTEDVDVASWVSYRVGRAVVDRLVEPLLGGVYAGNSDRLSLRATIPALWQRARGGQRLLDGAGQTVGGGGGPVFAGLRGGVGRLPLVLAAQLEKAGVQVRTGVAVRGLTRTPLTRRTWRLETGPAHSPEFIEADGVVLAVPPAPAVRLLAGEVPVAARELADVETASVGLVVAAVPRAQMAEVGGSGLLVPPVEGRAVKAATFSSAKWKWVSDESDHPNVIVRMSVGRARETALLERDDADLSALALADLADLIGRELRPVETAVVRWDEALPQYAVGHVERVHRIREAVAALPGLAVCGAAYDGVGIPACIAAADRAVLDLGPLTGPGPEPITLPEGPWV